MKKKPVDMDRVIPTNPTANITEEMRQERNQTPEVFDNAIILSSTATTSTTTPSVVNTFPKTEKEQRREVEITGIDDVRSFEADVIRTYSQSSGTISYDSINSLDEASLDAVKVDGRFVRIGSEKHCKAQWKEMSAESTPDIRKINDAEINRKMRLFKPPFENCEPTPPPTVVAFSETQLTRVLIEETVNQFFASPREDIELTVRLSRKNAFPKVHFELKSLAEHKCITTKELPLPPSASLFNNFAEEQKWNDKIEIENPFRSMEEQSAEMCTSAKSDVSTARTISTDYVGNAYSYLIAFVKSVVPKRNK